MTEDKEGTDDKIHSPYIHDLFYEIVCKIIIRCVTGNITPPPPGSFE